MVKSRVNVIVTEGWGFGLGVGVGVVVFTSTGGRLPDR